MPKTSDIQFMSTQYVNERNVQFSLIAIVPSWIRIISQQLIDSAKGYASRFGAGSRKFYFETKGSPNEFESTIYCVGPYVQATAFDITFNVPVGGFRPGDIDPMTGKPFPVGHGKYGDYIVLVDKPEAEGQDEKAVARSYSDKDKYSGKTITKSGFFSRALEKNIGQGIFLSDLGRQNLQNLALGVGIQMAHAIGNQIKWECARQGLSCYVQGPDVITTITSE
jgi:hypothetical protein